jgi:hypothetical protein
MIDDEEKAESTRRGYEKLEELDDMPELDYEPAPEDALEKYRREQLERQANDAAFRQREQAEQSEIQRQQQVRTMKADASWNAWMDGKIDTAIERDWTRRRAVIAEMITEESKQAGTAVGKIRADLCDEIHAALEKLRTRITALEQRDVVRHTSITRDGGEIIDITPGPSVTRKTRGPDAA